MDQKSRKEIGLWLLAGVFMIVIQILLGGITRLTGSGLSITQWDVIQGTLPPLNHEQWQIAFDQYKNFPQYKLMNNEMTLSGFKNIFWWEFIHRFWARLFVPVFAINAPRSSRQLATARTSTILRMPLCPSRMPFMLHNRNFSINTTLLIKA